MPEAPPAVTLEEPEDILIYYLDDKELESPMKYRMTDFLYQHAGDGVFVITLNQPKKLNSMRANFSQEILLVIIHAMKDERCKALVAHVTAATHGHQDVATPSSFDSKVALSSGVEMPFVGLGTYLQPADEVQASVEHALRCGYRHIDTAELYGTHDAVAKGIAASGVPRKDIFITDKLSGGGIFGVDPVTYDGTMAAISKALDLLQTQYIDLYLIHHPGAKDKRLEQWRALCDAQKQGLVMAIGVSNYSEKHIEEIKAAGLKMPEVNQIELHPMCAQAKLIPYLRANGILPMAYSSLAPCSGWRVEEGQGSAKKSDVHQKQMPLLESLLAKYSVSQAQLLLRWGLQKGYPILPKSSKPERVEANKQLFHFSISDEDMAQLDALDEDAAIAWPDPPATPGNPLNWE